MSEDILELQRLLKEVVEHLKQERRSDRRKAQMKLKQIAALATTMALVLESRNCR